MSCLTIVRDICLELGLPVPNAVVTSSDPQILQMLALLNKEGKYLAERPDQGWQALQLVATFNTVADETQVSIETIAPNYRYILNDTIWNQSNRRPVFGPLSPQQFRMQKGWFATGPYSQYRVQNGNINFIPVPSAGEECVFEYVTKEWVSGGGTSFTADNQTSLLDEELLRLGLMLRWKQIKGFDYAENKIEYEDRVNQAIARDTPKSILSMSKPQYGLPKLYTPDGNFPS